MGSRRVIQAGAIIMLILSLLNKFCAVFVTIPDPIVGGVYFVMFGKLILIIITDCFETDFTAQYCLVVRCVTVWTHPVAKAAPLAKFLFTMKELYV